MSVVTSLEETGPCRKKLTIEVPAEAVDAEMGRVVGSFRRNLKLPGFRQGKVPDSVVRRRFGEEIRQEVVDRLLPRYWRQAQAEKNLDPLLPPQVEDLELEPGKPMTVVASVEIRPEIELGDYRDFELPKGEVESGEAEVEDAITDLRRQHAVWIPVERAAGRGDLIVGRITDHTDGDGPAADQPIHVELGAEGVDEELTLALTGLSEGQSTEVRQGAGTDEEREMCVEVLAVKEQELPELDDEFAAKLGLETVDELRAAVDTSLRRDKEHDSRVARERALLEQLRRRHPFELPDGVVEKESERMLNEYAEQLHSRGVDIEQAGIDWEGLAGQVKPEAERRVHDRLLLDAVCAAENLRLDESEFERVLSSIAAQQKRSSLAVRQELSENGRLEPLRAQMLRQQAVRLLLGEDETEDPDSTDTANGT